MMDGAYIEMILFRKRQVWLWLELSDRISSIASQECHHLSRYERMLVPLSVVVYSNAVLRVVPCQIVHRRLVVDRYCLLKISEI